jgi:hypothetical protein
MTHSRPRVRYVLRLLACLSLIELVATAPPLRAQSTVPPERLAKFDRGDRLSRALLSTLRCGGAVSSARAAGVFGPVDSLGHVGQCPVIEGRRVGIFFDADSLFTHVTRMSAVDVQTRSRRQAPLDTTAVLAVARAELAGQLRGIKAYEDAGRPYVPVAFRFDGDSIEVWMLPAALLMGQSLSVGGERGYEFTPDGRTLVREIDAFADFRPLTLPDTGTVYIHSRGGDVPTLSEFLIANALNQQGRMVSIILPWGQSTLVGRGAQATWVQLVR